MAAPELDAFLQQTHIQAEAGQLQRLVLSKHQGDDTQLTRLSIRPIKLKESLMLCFVYEYRTQHITKNFTLSDGLAALENLIGTDFKNAHLVSDEWEIQLSLSKKGKFLVNKHRNPQFQNTAKTTEDLAPPLAHNKERHRYVAQDRPYLAALGITDQQGQIIPAMSRKWKQINKFIEVLARAIDNTGLAQKAPLHVADFGSGKAYLTFAVQDYLSQLGVATQVTGVELRQPLVDLCNDTAKKLSLSGIHFEQGDVKHFAAKDIHVMIALHACDTATDYAIHMGIRTGAQIIMCSPCCHKQIRPQLKSPALLAPLLQHGIHLGQEAEMLTDGLRALWLEAHGYDTQVFEFISLEHTSKNKMILAQKRATAKDNSQVLQQIQAIKDFYGIQEHCLESLLQNP